MLYNIHIGTDSKGREQFFHVHANNVTLAMCKGNIMVKDTEETQVHQNNHQNSHQNNKAHKARNRKERKRLDALHGRNSDTVKHAHAVHRDKLAYGRGMWNGTGTDDIRFRKAQEAAQAALGEVSHKEGLWWNLYLGKRIYSADRYRFFGTEKEAKERLEKMRAARQAVFASLSPIEEDDNWNLEDDPYWEEWLDYSQRTDSSNLYSPMKIVIQKAITEHLVSWIFYVMDM